MKRKIDEIHMNLGDFTHKTLVRFISSKNKFLAVEELARSYTDLSVCADSDDLIRTLKEREEIMSTGIGFGIAIPHAKIPCIKKISFAVGISKDGIDFDSMDGEPVQLIILVIASDTQHKEYLALLSKIMAMLKKPGVKNKITSAETPEEVISLVEIYGV
jgi:mannitol/fructose-specific phosphotransferase system IIA component (Ntr-type)